MMENKELGLKNINMSEKQIEYKLDIQKKKQNKKIKLRTIFEILAFFAGCLSITFGLLGIFGYASLFIGIGAIFAYSSAASFLVNLNYHSYCCQEWKDFQLCQKLSFCMKIYFVPTVLLVSGILFLGLGITGILNFGFGLGLGLSLISLAILPLINSIIVLNNKENAHRAYLLNAVTYWMNVVIILCTLISIVSIPLGIYSIFSLAATLIIGIPTAGVAISMGLLEWYEKNEYKKWIDSRDCDREDQSSIWESNTDEIYYDNSENRSVTDLYSNLTGSDLS